MLGQEIIRKKRDGHSLTKAEIEEFIRGLTKGTITESQIAAFAMAVYFKGMTIGETITLTKAMCASGVILDWAGKSEQGPILGPVVDKHSTGGIGDNTSLMLAPMLAACGCYVPMISGRGLGHTGGTLDKLEAIPGYQIDIDLKLFQQIVRAVGCAIIGPTPALAPADKRFYAVRDVTATVESIPLIVASILSKKLSAGLDVLVLDVKMGSGAFMESEAAAQNLAHMLVEVAEGAGVKTTALITDMNEPLASAAGNAVEVQNAVDYLTNQKQDPRLHEVVVALGVTALQRTGLCTAFEAKIKLEAVLASGQAAEAFQKMIAHQGGPKDFVARSHYYLPQAPIIKPVLAQRPGFVRHIKVRSLGISVIELGGGRKIATDKIDPAVGFSHLKAQGAWCEVGQPLALVHARTEEGYKRATQAIYNSYLLSERAPQHSPAVIVGGNMP